MAKLIVDQGDGVAKSTQMAIDAVGPKPIDHDRRRGRGSAVVPGKAPAQLPRELAAYSAKSSSPGSGSQKQAIVPTR